MQEKNRVTVRIAGMEYTICGTESAEHIQRVAMNVDFRIREIARHDRSLSTTMVAVLAALNISDELLKSQEAQQELQKEIHQSKRKVSTAADEKENIRKETTALKEAEKRAMLEVARLENEVRELRVALEEERALNQLWMEEVSSTHPQAKPDDKADHGQTADEQGTLFSDT